MRFKATRKWPVNGKLLFTAFTVQRGFAALDMSSDEMKCSDIVYNSSDFYSLQPIHVLLTINHGGQTNGLVHDVRMFSFLKSFERSYFEVEGTFLLTSSSRTEKPLLTSRAVPGIFCRGGGGQTQHTPHRGLPYTDRESSWKLLFSPLHRKLPLRALKKSKRTEFTLKRDFFD